MKKLTKIALMLGATFGVCAAEAGSYQLNDYSVTGLGRSYAGQGIMGDDYSAIAFNPAGMTLMEKSGVQQAFNFINLKADVDGMGQHKGHHSKMNFWQPVPAGFAQYNVNDRLKIGAGIYAPFGLKTHYDKGWFGSEAAILSKLDIVDFNISAAYKVTDHLSLGASAIVRYIYGRMTQDLPMFDVGYGPTGGGFMNFNVRGWSKTATLGAMYEFNKNSRIGISWRLRSAQRAKGKLKISDNVNNSVLGAITGGALMNGKYNVRANPDLPESIALSGYHRYQNLGFSGTARFTHWTSSFPDFVVRSRALPNGQKRTDYKYRNTWTLTAGVDYYFCKNLTFRFGGGWDESPTHKPERRTIRIPDNDRWWMSVGASYMKNNWQVDVGFAHMIAKTGKATEDKGSALSAPNHAKYKNMQSNILGVQFQYKF